MHLLVADRSQRGDHHVETVEPRPTLDEMKSCGADQNYAEQGEPDQSQVAK